MHLTDWQKYFSITALLILIAGVSHGQLSPAPNDTLNYTQVMFDLIPREGAKSYIVEIIEETSTPSFAHPDITKTSQAPAVMIDNFKFGTHYLWRYKASSETTWQGPYKFEITSETRLNSFGLKAHVHINDTSQTTDGLILMDNMRAAVNRRGEAVWYLVQTKDYEGKIRVIRPTRTGTFTYLSGNDAVDLDLKGHVLWKAPLPILDTTTKHSPNKDNYTYHHDFKKLPNGNYMVLGSKNILSRLLQAQGQGGTHEILNNNADNDPTKDHLGTLIEFNTEGKVVWFWNGDTYFTPADLIPADSANITDDKKIEEPHLNAFAADSAGRYVYAGFRDISRVIKIDKKTKQVVYSWGSAMKSGEARDGHDFFHHQHDVFLYGDNDIGVFNNEEEDDTLPSSVVIFKQPGNTEKSKIEWRYACNSPLTDKAKSKRGGNVDLLKNNHFLICMGSANRLVEIDDTGKVIWYCTVENMDSSTTLPLPYQMHYTSSLYPCYFALQNGGRSGNNTTVNNYSIFNVGSEADCYNIKITSTSGLYNQQFGTARLQSHDTLNLSITLDKGIKEGDIVTVLVSSKSNPSLVRRFQITIRR